MSSRLRLLKKIHVAKRQLAVEEESYRLLLIRVTGKASCSVMTESELVAVIAEFKRLGWSDAPRPPKRAGDRAMARDAVARKIRALWLSLYHMGEIEDPSEAALAAFVLRTTGVEALQWMDGIQQDAVIKALRGWQDRIGLPRVDAIAIRHVDRARERKGLPLQGEGFAAKTWVIHFQWARLGDLTRLGCSKLEWLARHFNVGEPAHLSPEDADRAIERLGRLIRSAKAKAVKPKATKADDAG